MTDLPILSLISTTALVAGLVFAALQVQLAQKQRTRDSSIHLMQSFRTPEFVAGIGALINLPDGLSKAEVEKQLGDKMDNVLLLMLTLESVGILVQKREIPIELAEDFFTGPIVLGWRRMEKYTYELRQQMRVDTPMEYFQWLAERVIARQKSHPSPPAHVAHRGWKA